MEGKQPIKSPNDKNSYKIVKLTNKLEALLISSPGTPFLFPHSIQRNMNRCG